MSPNRPLALPPTLRSLKFRLRRNAVLWGGVALILPVLACAENRNTGPIRGQIFPVSPSQASAPQTFDFNIPAQSLVTALQRYGNIAKKPVLYRSEIITGQISATVRGRYSAEQALRLLLAGSGLTAEKFIRGSDDIFILKNLQASSTMRIASLGNLSGYPALLQSRVWQALCDNPQTRPGEYRALLRFQVDVRGQVQCVRQIGSTGNKTRDWAVLDTVRQVRVGGVPPTNMRQPVTLLILPRQEGFNMYCHNDHVRGAQ